MTDAVHSNNRLFSQAENKFIQQNGDLGKALLDLYELKDAEEALEYNYHGEYDTKEDFAQSYMRDRAEEVLSDGSFEQHILINWCNWEHVAWELFINDYTAIEVDNKIHVLRSF